MGINLRIKEKSGFSLIELILIMLILSILSITILPKFFTKKGFVEYGYRADAIAKVRSIQLRAMQQTDNRSVFCHRVLIATKQLGAPIGDCDSTPTFISTWKVNATGMQISSGDNITFSTNVSDNQILFDAMGRPTNCGPCDIIISGEQTLTVRVEKEGYIHAL